MSGLGKKTIREFVWDIYDLDGPVDTLQERILACGRDSLTRYLSYDIEVEHDEGSYGDPCSVKINLYGHRLETDQEFAKRLKQEEKNRIKKAKEKERAAKRREGDKRRAKEREVKTFEELIKKYGKEPKFQDKIKQILGEKNV